MKATLVLDASVAVKWLFTDEPERDRALAVLQRLAERPDSFVVPDLFFVEVAAVCVRKSGWNGKFVTDAMRTIRDLGVQTMADGGKFQDTVLDMACQFKLSYYDAVYAGTASELNGSWLTADLTAANKLPKHLVTRLADFI